MPDYYNYHHRIGDEPQLRRSFLSHLWRAYQRDSHWSPPEFQAMRSTVMSPPAHISRQQPVYIHTHAIRQRDHGRSDPMDWLGAGPLQMGPITEETVGLGAILHDPRRDDRTACLAFMITANQPDCLEQLLAALLEESTTRGYQRIIGPTGFSMHLGGGLLVDHWQDTPPVYTAYAPPFMAETVFSVMTPVQTTRLYHLAVPARPEEVSGPARFVTCDPADLKTNLMPLFQAAVRSHPLAVELDAPEADFLLDWIDSWPMTIWLAIHQGRPSGFVLLQPDSSPLLKRANGGRWPWWRLWLRLATRQTFSTGRIVFGGVLPDARGLGLGTQLLTKSLHTAQEKGWKKLTIGPLPEDSPAARLLVRIGAQPRQTYHFYQWP